MNGWMNKVKERMISQSLCNSEIQWFHIRSVLQKDPKQSFSSSPWRPGKLTVQGGCIQGSPSTCIGSSLFVLKPQRTKITQWASLSQRIRLSPPGKLKWEVLICPHRSGSLRLSWGVGVIKKKFPGPRQGYWLSRSRRLHFDEYYGWFCCFGLQTLLWETLPWVSSEVHRSLGNSG